MQSSAAYAQPTDPLGPRALRPLVTKPRELRTSRPSERPVDEMEFVERLVRSDPSAWRRFSREYSPVVIGCIRRVLSRFSRVTSDHDVDEVYARFCCELLAKDRKKLRRFDADKGSRLSTWLGLLATNATYDYLRRLKRDRVCEPMPETDVLQTGDASPYDRVVLQEKADIAVQVMRELSERDREFVELYFAEGLEAEQISERMGISVKTVYTKKHKITARLESIVARTEATCLA